ncbi:Prim1 [Scenedesmus sp. PABB004]|nr:Prim1 [Scenedesmus sp. PABB004]
MADAQEQQGARPGCAGSTGPGAAAGRPAASPRRDAAAARRCCGAAPDAKRAKTEPGEPPADQGVPEPMALDAAPQRDAPPHAPAAAGGEPSMRALMAQYYRERRRLAGGAGGGGRAPRCGAQQRERPGAEAPRPLPLRRAGRLFPVQHMFRWLCYGNDGSHGAADASFAGRREICYTLEGDIFCRYQSFKSWSDLAAELARKVPTKIDIGPVYTHDPRQRAKYAKDFKPVQRELVIDIDLTDYDGLRTCGSGGHICARCWPFIAVAMQVLDVALRADFGFRHILWVYSGRRGVHAWVSDEGARRLADDVRGAVVTYLSVIRGTEAGLAKLGYGLVKHPALERAEGMLRRAWREVRGAAARRRRRRRRRCRDACEPRPTGPAAAAAVAAQHLLPAQELLETPEAWGPLLRYIPDEDLTRDLAARWAAGGQGLMPDGKPSRRRSAAAGAAKEEDGAGDACCLSVRRWNELERAVKDKARSLGGVRGRALEKGLGDILFAYSYPRLDVEVTKKMNHLLKAPFCVHPKTGKVCVPIDPAAAWEFDPDAVPTVRELVAALDTAGPAAQQVRRRGSGRRRARGGVAPRCRTRAADACAAALARAQAPGAGEGWRGTALEPYVEAFASRFLSPLAAANRAALNDKAKAAAAEGRAARADVVSCPSRFARAAVDNRDRTARATRASACDAMGGLFSRCCGGGARAAREPLLGDGGASAAAAAPQPGAAYTPPAPVEAVKEVAAAPKAAPAPPAPEPVAAAAPAVEAPRAPSPPAPAAPAAPAAPEPAAAVAAVAPPEPAPAPAAVAAPAAPAPAPAAPAAAAPAAAAPAAGAAQGQQGGGRGGNRGGGGGGGNRGGGRGGGKRGKGGGRK